ncbi:hypothetical protein OUZ56_018641 [Daphnia magna]|uniref:C3H1-type domain-containing protein n=1 Tax=Daphnia magna TaxID=35525 RepID=A0ABQ9Z9D6_9CRUS|nr:hypothetical protein OUZ56_018641 [Daphnia magna]
MIHPLIELRCDRGDESLQIISARSRYGDMCYGRGKCPRYHSYCFNAFTDYTRRHLRQLCPIVSNGMGILQFSDSNYKPETNNTYTVQVKYTVYSDERAVLVIVPDQISIDTTPSECYDTINNKRCGEHHLTFSDNKYVFGRDPEIVGYWLQTIDSEILNCVLEQVQLYQQMEDEDFLAIIGKAAAKSCNLLHNHLTLVWDKTYTQKSQHTLRIVESGTGILTKKLEEEKFFLFWTIAANWIFI